MTITEHIKILYMSSNISVAELARRIEKSPLAFNAKMRRKSFRTEELKVIAQAAHHTFQRNFILSNREIA